MCTCLSDFMIIKRKKNGRDYVEDYVTNNPRVSAMSQGFLVIYDQETEEFIFFNKHFNSTGKL